MKVTNHLNPSKKFDIEELIEFLSDALEISDNVELTLIYNNKLLDKLSNQVDYSAFLFSPQPHHYILYVREDIDLSYVICHELVHLKQYESGNLKVSADFKEITWNGHVYNDNYPYDKREWEQEAFSKQFVLWKMFKKFKRNERAKTKVQ